MKQWIKNNKKILVFVLYALITFIVLLFHENWRDEAQSWLLVKECNLSELISAMKYEGHFLLWFLILMPFAKLGLPYITMNIVSWLISCISVWLILSKAPFKFYKKALLVFTFPILYAFPIVARCYCLIPLAISLLCIFYKERKEKPFRFLISVVLLANTHIIMLSLVGIILLDFIIELIKDWKNQLELPNKKRLVSFIITVLLLIVSAIPLLGSLDTNSTVLIDSTNISLKNIGNVIFVQPLSLISEIFLAFINSPVVLFIIFSLTSILVFIEIKYNTLDSIKIIIIILWQCIIYTFIYSSSFQRASTILLIVLYFKWISAYKKSKKEKTSFAKTITDLCCIPLLVLNIYCGLVYCNNDVKCNFSNSIDIGTYINNNIDDNSIIVCSSEAEWFTSIIPYVKPSIKFYHISGNRFFTYTIWDSENELQAFSEWRRNRTA